jgi:hypothetical protein
MTVPLPIVIVCLNLAAPSTIGNYWINCTIGGLWGVVVGIFFIPPWWKQSPPNPAAASKPTAVQSMDPNAPPPMDFNLPREFSCRAYQTTSQNEGGKDWRCVIECNGCKRKVLDIGFDFPHMGSNVWAATSNHHCPLKEAERLASLRSRPWRVDYKRDGALEVRVDEPRGMWCTLAWPYFKEDGDEAYAARIIYAARDLLEACSEAASDWDDIRSLRQGTVERLIAAKELALKGDL